jgi:lysophospholipase L1-like esterase
MTMFAPLLSAWLTAGAQAPPPQTAPAQPAANPQAAPQISFPGQYALSPADWKFPVWPRGCGRFEGAERTECLEFVGFDYGRLSRFAAANAVLAAPRSGEPRVVFFGDSITDNWSKAGYGGFFPGRPYVNRGIGGQTTSQMLVRFRADVLAIKAGVVVILAGTNDIAGNAGPVALEAVEDNLTDMVELARTHDVRAVLAALLPVSDDKKDAKGQPIARTTDRPPATIQALNRWLADYAKKNDAVYLDYYSALADTGGRLKPELTDDGLHPNAAGYALMAPLAEKAIAQALHRAPPAASR